MRIKFADDGFISTFDWSQILKGVKLRLKGSTLKSDSCICIEI